MFRVCLRLHVLAFMIQRLLRFDKDVFAFDLFMNSFTMDKEGWEGWEGWKGTRYAIRS
jgi:hypothetical protein